MVVLKQYFQNFIRTVEPLLSGHPRGMARWPLNRGGRLIEVAKYGQEYGQMFFIFTFKSLFITKVINR